MKWGEVGSHEMKEDKKRWREEMALHYMTFFHSTTTFHGSESDSETLHDMTWQYITVTSRCHGIHMPWQLRWHCVAWCETTWRDLTLREHYTSWHCIQFSYITLYVPYVPSCRLFLLDYIQPLRAIFCHWKTNATKLEVLCCRIALVLGCLRLEKMEK
jgi:hypothetical protein